MTEKLGDKIEKNLPEGKAKTQTKEKKIRVPIQEVQHNKKSSRKIKRKIKGKKSSKFIYIF